MTLEIIQIPVLQDNYVYLLHDEASGEAAVVDPAVPEPVLDILNQRDWTLNYILNTHHHFDHVGGNEALKAATGCKIIGAAHDADRIPGIDIKVAEGDTVQLGTQTAKVFDVPGHTSGHIAYWFEGAEALFCGDTLFAMGCGRLFEGSPEQMWHSLSKLRGLPDETRVYCAHEYTMANGDFALSIEPENAALNKRMDEVITLREAGKPTVPSLLGDEKDTNPFLRADNPETLAAAGLAGQDAVAAFAEIRKRKDNF